MLGVLVNTVAVLIGSTIGLLFKKGIPQKYSDAVMTGIALCTVYIGISGALKGENTIVLIVSMALGAALGTLMDLDSCLNRLGQFVEKKFSKNDGTASIAQGFITASLLFCVGAMTIVGSLTAGLTGDNEMLYTKSVLDLISASMLSVSLGIGVMFSAVFVLVFQGGLTLLSAWVGTALSEAVVTEMSAVGGVILIGMALNLLQCSRERIKVANMLPAIFLPILWTAVSSLLK